MQIYSRARKRAVESELRTPSILGGKVAELELVIDHVGDNLAVKVEQREVHEHRPCASVGAQLLLDTLYCHVPIKADLEHARLQIGVCNVQEDGRLALRLPARLIRDVVAESLQICCADIPPPLFCP